MKTVAVEPQTKTSGSNSVPKLAPSRIQWLETKLFAWLPAISFVFMAYSSITAIYQSKGDPGTVSFVVGSLLILSALYWCMKEFETAVSHGEAVKKEQLKIAIWVLATALNALFSFRVTTVIDSVVFSIIIWALAGLTTAAGCYLMFFATQGSNGATVPL